MLYNELPDLAEDLAADAFAPSLPAGHHAAGRGHDADTKSALRALDLVATDVDAATGPGYARQVANSGFVVGAVLEVDTQNCAAILFRGLVVRDIAFFFKDAGNLGLQLRCRNIQLLVARTDGVTDARHKVGYWIGQTHSLSSTPRSLRPES